MKVAIHHRQGSFSDRWIEYCKKKNIEYRIVSCFDSDIIEKIRGCEIFVWHYSHASFKDIICAKKILFALENAGVKVFPDFRTAWHFDDKVAQKYLLESIDAPLVPSYIFYDKKEASDWVKQTSYPKVFKLKGGAGATNVKLVRTQKEALKLVSKAFNKGFPQFNRLGNLEERYNKYMCGQDTLSGVVKGVGRLFVTTSFAKQQPPEKGYIYFQEFIPNDGFDIRVIVIGEKAFAIKRLVRLNDFRASGSGRIVYNPESINKKCLAMAFDTNNRIGSQCIAYDFVLDSSDGDEPMIIEISYGFSVEAYDTCPGYWDNQLNWHESKFNPQEWMIENLLKSMKHP